MTLFADSKKVIHAIERAAALVAEFPPSLDRDAALRSLTDAGALALRASTRKHHVEESLEATDCPCEDPEDVV